MDGKEIDIAAQFAAQLIYSQKVTIKYAGVPFSQMTRNCQICSEKSEIGKTSISKRKTISATMMRDVKRCSSISTSWMYRTMKMG